MAQFIPATYVDQIGKIHLHNGMVILEGVQQIPGAAEDEPKASPVARVVMPPAAMLNLYSSLGEMINKMAAAGMVTLPKAPTDAPAEAPAEEAAPAEK